MREYNRKNRDKLRKYRADWQRNWRKANPEKQTELSKKWTQNRIKKLGEKEYYKLITNSVRKWRKKHPERRVAHGVVFVAKRNGTLKQSPCEVCGETKSQAHHEDYAKPLDVRWLCKRHHIEADKMRGRDVHLLSPTN